MDIWQSKFSKSTAKMGESMIRQLVAQTKGVPGLISFAGGFPDPQTFPKSGLADLFASVIKEDGDDILQYGASSGDTQLIDEIRRWENIQESTDELLITVGSTNAIYCYTRALVDEGDVIICEAPSFLGSVVAFESVGAEVVGVDMDADGLVMSDLKATITRLKAAGKNIKFIYTIPEFQNPTGITMSLARRRELIQIAIDEQIPVLEDNPYGVLRYEGSAHQDLYKLSRTEFDSDIVTCVKSFSKILGPGLRLAYAIGNASLINKMSSWMQKISVSADNVTQRAVAHYMKNNLLLPHIEQIVSYYRPKQQAMLTALKSSMPAGIRWTIPQGGMFVWIYLPENICGDKLFQLAIKQKIAFIPGSKFYPQGAEKYHEIRLNFSYPSIEQIEVGVKRLAELLSTLT